MVDGSEEDEMLHSVAMQTSESIFLARRRAEDELTTTRQALKLKTLELEQALARMEESLRDLELAQAQVEESRLAAVAANDAKTRFVTMISHELRTPLGAIGGYANLIDAETAGPVTPRQREFVLRILHNQKHLLSLVSQLLDVGRIESGRLDLMICPLPINSLVDDVRPMIDPHAEAGGIELDIEPADASILVNADRERVEQIVLNLLSNAVKFCGTGGSVRVSSSSTREQVCLHVRDAGVGIAPEMLQAVFDPFFRIASMSGKTPVGTGLGLTISRQLARAMGGDLTVESRVGQGSTFTLILPRVSIESDEPGVSGAGASNLVPEIG